MSITSSQYWEASLQFAYEGATFWADTNARWQRSLAFALDQPDEELAVRCLASCIRTQENVERHQAHYAEALAALNAHRAGATEEGLTEAAPSLRRPPVGAGPTDGPSSVEAQ